MPTLSIYPFWRFGQFAHTHCATLRPVVVQWTGKFEPGVGHVFLYKAGDSTPFFNVSNIPLTPGPLNIVVKCPVLPINSKPSDYPCWPPVGGGPQHDEQPGMYVEAVAGSFRNNDDTYDKDKRAFVRMVNLSPNAHGAGLRVNSSSMFNATLTTGESSTWVNISLGKTMFEATAYSSKWPYGLIGLGNVSQSPLAAPATTTMWLLGQIDDAKFPITLLPLIDAPPPNAGVGTFCS